jgi:flagellar biosynthesis/type III secretory pathway M-ring protein FliF/YscJ
MRRGNVNVIVDGASYDIKDKGGENFAGGADDVMEAIQAGERYYTEKVEKILRRFHPGVMVMVTVEPKTSSSQLERQEYDKAKTFDKPIESTDRTEENTSSSRAPVEPGAVPNTGSNVGANRSLELGVSGGGGEGTSSNTTENKVRNQVFPSVTKEWVKNPAGGMPVVGATISVPRSHFVAIFKRSYPDAAKEPDDAALGPIIDKELSEIEKVAEGALPIAADKVKTSVYYDYVPAGAGDAAAQPATATSFPLAAIRGYAREIALGSLAVFSLFMVSMMVRKGSPVAMAPPPRMERERPSPMPPPEHVAGEAMQGDQTMEAVEIDDQAVKTQQMISQVQNMVRENPDGAANLVKRWLNRA